MKNIILVILVASAFFSCNAYVWADDIEDEIGRALESYKAKDYSASISSLDFAAQQIRQLKAAGIGTAFPEPLPGWTAKSPESSSMGGAMMGGMISNSRKYLKGDASVEIAIVTDSPMIQMVSGLFANPMFGAPGMEVMRIKGEKALLQWSPEEPRGELQIILGNNLLITVTGEHCEKADIIDYANAVDFKKAMSQ